MNKKEDLLLVLGTIALAAAVLAVIAFTRPVTRTLSEDINYQQNGMFSYSAAVPSGIFDFENLQTGEPIFLRLINRVNIHFNYQIDSDQPVDIQGAAGLIAQLSDVNGWKRTFELQKAIPFNGEETSVSGTLDLDQIQSVINNLQSQTGINRHLYTLSIIPQITIMGTVSGEAVSENFTPQLDFQIDSLEMRLVQPNPPELDPIHPGVEGLLKRPRIVPNVFSLLGLELPVLTVRWILSVLLVLALGGLVALGLTANHDIRSGGEPARIQLKYGPLLVSVLGRQTRPVEQIVVVETIDDLAKLADKDSRPILHEMRARQHIYFVQDTNLIYRYVIDETDNSKSALQEKKE